MEQKFRRFGKLLKEAVERVYAKTGQGKVIFLDRWGLGFSRETYYRWERGEHLPDAETLSRLAADLMERGGLDCNQLKEWLTSADFDEAEELVDELCPAPHNPFSPGQPIYQPRYFFGRAQLLAEIFDLWRNSNLAQPSLFNGLLLGPKGSGKTSLLHYARTITTASPQELRPRQSPPWLLRPIAPHWVLVDFADPGHRHTATLLSYILRQLGLSSEEECTPLKFSRLVRENLHHPTVILMDEFDKVFNSDDFELDKAFWDSLLALQRSPEVKGKLAFFIAAERHPKELAQLRGFTSFFFDYFRCLNACKGLGPFSEVETLEFVNGSLALSRNSRVAFTQADLDWIWRHSQGWPYRLQICGYYCWQARARGDSGDGWQASAAAEM